MSKNLYLFATSARADVYINSLAHAIDKHGIEKLHLIVVSEHGYISEQSSSENASNIFSSICHQLENLTVGEYNNSSSGSKISVSGDTGIYKSCLSLINRGGSSIIVIPANELEEKLKEYSNKKASIFDVSALKKNLLTDVVSCLISIRHKYVYSFELIKEPDFNERDLYHNLNRDDFVYRNLLDSKIVQNSMNRIARWHARTKLISILVFILFLIITPISFYLGETKYFYSLNIIALVCSIASFLFLFSQKE